MTQLKNRKMFLIYILLFFIAAIVLKTVNVKADTKEESPTKVNDKVYKVEIKSSLDFDEIKNEVLAKDVKYVALPLKLVHDVALSEIVASNIDYASKKVQEVDLEIERYTDSKNNKTKIDTVEGKLKLQFIDTTPPKIRLKQNSLTIEEGSKLKAKNYLLDVTDNSFDEVEVDIDNQVDTNKPGEYEVVYKATDSSNNSSERSLLVTVEEKPKPEPKPEPIVKVVANNTTANNTPANSTPVNNKPVSNTPVVSAPVVSAPAVSNDYYGALALVNSHRAARGLHALQLAGPSEQAAALLRAAEASGYVSHTRPDGRSYRTAFTDRGLSHNNVIEVLVYAGSTAADKVNWWMNSPVHSSVLMRSNITHIAFGASGGMWAGIVYS